MNSQNGTKVRAGSKIMPCGGGGVGGRDGGGAKSQKATGKTLKFTQRYRRHLAICSEYGPFLFGVKAPPETKNPD